MLETIKLLGSTKSTINQNEMVKMHLNCKITEVELVHCDNVNNGSQKDSIVLCKFFSDKSFNLL